MNDDSNLSLQALDPEARDPGYWHRFHRRVLSAASAELSRRRAGTEATVSEVVSSWGRAVVPTALAAALLAGVLLFQESSPGTTPPALADVEELLAGDLGDEPIPVVLASEDEVPGRALEEF